jgi:hypothetical protein
MKVVKGEFGGSDDALQESGINGCLIVAAKGKGEGGGGKPCSMQGPVGVCGGHNSMPVCMCAT